MSAQTSTGPNNADEATTATAGALRTPKAESPRPTVPPVSHDELLTGWLREHGEAPHEFRPRAEASYFVRLETPSGMRTLWSPGLRRAMLEARTKPQIGDEIGVRQIEVTPVARAHAGQRGSPPQPRSYWIIERRAYFAEREAAAKALRDPNVPPREAIRNHPELLGAYFALDSARKVAEARIAHAESRDRFVALVRESLAHATERGEPLPVAVRSSRAPARGASAKRVKTRPRRADLDPPSR